MDRWGEFARMTVEAINRAPAEQILVVAYRDLVRNFEENLSRIHSFLELPAPDFAGLRANPDKTLLPQPASLDRWKQEIDQADIDYFDTTYGAVSEALGLD
jgi:hypothetical protein